MTRKMPKDTRTALEASIMHWEENLELVLSGRGMQPDVSAGSCALCGRFWGDTANDRCTYNGERCPVFAATDERVCRGSPYYAVDDALVHWNDAYTHGEMSAAWKELVQACKAEVDFLRGLLPKEGE